MWNLKYDTNELICKTETDSQTERTKLWMPRGRRGGKDWEFGVSRCKLLYIGWINSKVLLQSTGNYIQYPVINHRGKEYKKKECLYACNWVTLLYSRDWHSIGNQLYRASLVAQWLRICLPMQGTRVWALVWEDPTCRGAIGPVSHDYWACASGACAPQQERPR